MESKLGVRALCAAVGALAFVSATALAQEPRAEERELALAAGDPVADPHGRSKTFEYVVAASGSLHVWAISSACDPRLVVRDAGGATLAEDDDSGGRPAAFVDLKVDAGAKLAITAQAQTADGLGAIQVSLRELPETDATRELAEFCRKAVVDEIRLRAANRHADARASLAAASQRLLETPAAANSAECLRASLDVMQDAYHLDDATVSRALTRFRLDAIERQWPPDSKALQEARLQVASVLIETNDRLVGHALIEQACAVYERTLTDADVELGMAQLSSGQVAQELGNLDVAIPRMRAAVASIERAAPTATRKIAIARSLLGLVLADYGLFDEARALEEQALAAMEHVFGPDDPFRLSAQTYLATTLSAMGDHQGALVLQQQVLDVLERSSPPGAPALLASRMNIGVQLLSLGRAEEALETFRRTVAEDELSDDWSVESSVRARTNLAVALDDLGRHEEALALLAELRTNPRWNTPNDSDLRWRIAAEAAIACQELGRSEQALEHARTAVALIAPSHAPNWPDLVDMRNLVAKVALANGERDEALEQARAAADGAKSYFAQCAATMSSRQAESIQFNWSRLVADPLYVLGRVARDEDRAALDALALDLVESARNVAATSIGVEHALATDSARDEIERLRDEIRRQSHEVARAAAREDGEQDVHVRTNAKENAERQLKLLLSRSSSARLLDVDAAAIAKALAPDAAAISFWSYEDRSGTVRYHLPCPRRLVAFVLRTDKPVARVELGPLAPIRVACVAWREALLGDDANATRARGETVRRLVFDPLKSALGPARVWHVALDDELQTVPLDVLPEGDGLLGDRARILATPTLGELTRDPARRDGLFVAVGGVDYDHGRDQEPPARPSLIAASTSALRSGLRGDFAPLWDTATEISEIAALYRQRSRDAKVELLEERDATKSALLELAPRARFLHIATHGFFAPESVPAIGDLVAGADPLSTPETAVSVAGFAPLALCGLALSGANLAPDDDHGDEGCVTAEELAHVDLGGCELVVLSACDTNVGFLRAGRGIASFQRALHAAGARNVVTSLWKVSDEATRELMLAFYKALWIDGASKADALWQAKSTLRSRRAQPRDYAGWVLSGAGK